MRDLFGYISIVAVVVICIITILITMFSITLSYFVDKLIEYIRGDE
jgi:hypothetical protein